MLSKTEENVRVVKTLDFNKVRIIDKKLLDKISSKMISDIISQ